jgi:hypothetical protein
MKKNDFLMGILSMVLVFGLAMFVGCKTDDDDGDGGTFAVTVTGLTAGSTVRVSFGWSFSGGYGSVGYDPRKEVTVDSNGSATVDHSSFITSTFGKDLLDNDTPIRVEISPAKNSYGAWSPQYRSKANYSLKDGSITIA